MRKSEITRNTAETQIKLALCLDGTGKSQIKTGVGFLDHMLTLFAKHARFDLELDCTGDTCVDFHHTTEDIGIALGKALAESLGDMRGINRYADIILPMDESLIMCAVDVSGRSYLGFDVDFPTNKIGDFDTELVEEFLLGFVRNANITLHVRKMAGTNSHHIAEGIFKALARVIGGAVKINQEYKDEIPSTKGVL